MTTDKNHVATVTDSTGAIGRYTWDPVKDLLSSFEDGNGHITTYTYDAARRLTQVSQDVSIGGATQTASCQYAYTDGRLTSITHNGFQYGFTYDIFGNLKKASAAGTDLVTYTYEAPNGNLLKALYADGSYFRYEYDAMDRVKETYGHTNGTSGEAHLYSFVYNRQGELDHVVTDPDGAGRTSWLAYDFLGRLMRVRDGDGCISEFTYDVNSRMTKLYHQNGGMEASSGYAYDNDGRETALTAGGKTRTSAYDEYGRLLSRTWDTASPYSISLNYPYSGQRKSARPNKITTGGRVISYAYDSNGNITQVSDKANASATAVNVYYHYDERNQLVREDSQMQGRTFVYAYDIGGNLASVKEYAYTTAATITGSPAATHTATYSTTWKDQMKTWDGVSLTYDANGSLKTKGSTTYTWGPGRRLLSVNNGTAASYEYDHTGMRTKKTVGGTVTKYHYMNGGLLMSEDTGSRNIRYLYDSNADLAGLEVDGNAYFYIKNLQNDIIGIMDSSGTVVVKYSYDSWGKVLSVTGPGAGGIGSFNPFRYRGYYYDAETGMYYLKSRYYDPGIKRFICCDELFTIGVPEGAKNNTYSYCNNNPSTLNDGSGHWPTSFLPSVKKAFIAIKEIIVTAYNAAKIKIKIALSNLPTTGQEPWSWQIEPNPDGSPKQKRWYDGNGDAMRDRDYNHSGNMEFPHDHVWKNGKRSKEHESPSPDYNFSWEPVIGIGVIFISSVGAAFIAFDDLTGIGAADDFLLAPITEMMAKGFEMVGQF